MELLLPRSSRTQGAAVSSHIDQARGDQAQNDRMPVATLLVLAAAVFAGVTTEILPVGLLPDIADSLQTSVGAIGLLVSGFAVVVAVGSIPMAIATARFSRRNTLRFVLLGYAISNLVVALTSNYAVMLGARMVAGLAHAALFPTAIALAVESVSPRRAAQAVAFVNGGVVVALGFGVPIGTTLGNALGWRWSFTAAALVLLLLATAVPFIVPDSVTIPAQKGSSSRALLTRPALLMLAGGIIVLTLGHYTAYTYISPMLLHAGVANGAIGPVLFGYGLAGVLGLVAAGRLGGSRPRLVLCATVITAVIALLAIAALAHSPAGTVGAVVLWGACFGGLPSLLQTAALRLTPNDAAIAPAMVNSMFNVGICGGAAVGGHLLRLSPVAAPLFAATLMTASLALLLPRSQRKPSPPERVVGHWQGK